MLRIEGMGSGLVFALALCAQGCVSYQALQPAETLPEGRTSLGLGVMGVGYDLPHETETGDTAHRFQFVPVPSLTGWMRHGVTDALQVNAQVWLLGWSVGAKYMLVGQRDVPGFVLSAGLDVANFSMSGNRVSNLGTVMLPLYLGIRTHRDFELYLTPRYVLFPQALPGGRLHHALGGTLGVALGHWTQLLAELSAAYDPNFAEGWVLQGAVGLDFL